VDPIDIAAVADDFDRDVAVTPAIDRFCSSSAWILAAASALMPPRAPFSFRGTSGYFAAMRGVHPAGFPYIEPLELAWGLAAPLIGRDAATLATEVAVMLAARRDWQLAVLAGMTHDGPQRRALDRVLPPRWERRRGTSTVRHVASLDGGVDGFLSRRSRDLRKSLRKSDFVYPPGSRIGGSQGRYPIDTKKRARAALRYSARADTAGTYKPVSHKVYQRYPSLSTS